MFISNTDSLTGQVPYLVVDGHSLPQSISIGRFLARKFGLAGKDELEQAKADAIVDSIVDFQVTWAKACLYAADKEAALTKFKEEEAPDHFGRIQKLIGLYGSNGFAVGDALTWADLFIHTTVILLNSTVPDLSIDSFPVIVASKNAVEANENVAAYLARRPPAPF